MINVSKLYESREENVLVLDVKNVPQSLKDEIFYAAYYVYSMYQNIRIGPHEDDDSEAQKAMEEFSELMEKSERYMPTEKRVIAVRHQ